MEARVKPRQRFDEKPPSHGKSLPTRLAGLEQFLDAAPDAMVGVDNDGKIVLVNWQAEKLLGYTIRELTGRRIEMLLPERFRHQHIEHRKNYLANVRVRPMGANLDLYARRKDGVEIPVEISLSPLETEEGLLVLSSIRDITERKRKEKQLQASEARLRRLLETTNAIPWEANAKTWQFTYVGPQAVKLLGYPVDQWYEQDFWAGHIDPEDREYAIDFCLKSSQRFKDYEFEYRMIAADGRIVWMHDIVSVTSVNGAPETLRGFMIDITERKQTEQALRKREQQLRAFFEDSATDINLKDAEGRYILTSRQFEKTFGLARGEAEGKFPHDIFPKDFADHVRAQDLAILRTGKLIYQEDLVPDSDPPITLLVSKFPISEETGEVIGLGVIATDITEHKRAEQALREAHDQLESRVQERTQELAEANAALRAEVTEREKAEQQLDERLRFQRLLSEISAEFTDLPVGGVDGKIENGMRRLGEFMDVDCCFVNQLSEDRTELRTTHFWTTENLKPDRFLGKVFLNEQVPWYTARMMSGQSLIFSRVDELPDKAVPEKAYARSVGIKSSAIVPLIVDGDVIGNFGVDAMRSERNWPESLIQGLKIIGEIFGNALVRKRSEMKLRTAEREAAKSREHLAHLTRVQSMGEMAAGIAHEINQPLAAIENYAQACERRLKAETVDREKIEELVEKIKDQTHRAGNVLSRLRAMVKRQPVRMMPVDLNSVIRETVELANIESQFHDCQLNVELAPSLPAVVIDPIQIQQVVLNLIHNAIEASDAVGSDKERVVVVRTGKKSANHLEVSVADCGLGVTDVEADHMFEPFYSTKRSGLGMGLSLCRSIVNIHGGKIWHSRGPSAGTIFHFSLPVDTDESAG